MAKVKTFEIFTSKYSQVVQAETAGIAVNKFAKDHADYNDIIAVVDTERGGEFLKDTGNWNKHSVINRVPFQVCPKCGGDGNLLRYNSPALMGMTTPICDVCDGKKIIPMAHWL